MNQNVNEAESFVGDFVASEEGLLFFEVPLGRNCCKWRYEFGELLNWEINR